MSEPALIDVRNVAKTFRTRSGGEVPALSDIALSIGAREFLCIVGPSGCGKTALLMLVAGFERPTAGRVVLDGDEVTRPDRRRTVVFQEDGLFPWKTLAENVEFVL